MRAAWLAMVLIACAERDTPVTPRGLLGVAVADTAGGWCAAFPRDSAHDLTNASVTVVFPGDSAAMTRRGRLQERRSAPCGTAFPQPRWDSYQALSMVLDGDDVTSAVGVVVTGDVPISREHGAVRGDIDGDGIIEEFRRCAADEGEHVTVWSGTPPTRRWHDYFDWGVIVDPTCLAGEDGRDD